MPLPVLQCEDCMFNVRWEVNDENFPGKYICDKYPNGIPLDVEDGIDDCVEYQQKV